MQWEVAADPRLRERAAGECGAGGERARRRGGARPRPRRPRGTRRGPRDRRRRPAGGRSEEHTSELQSRLHLVCRLLLEKKKNEYVSCSFVNYNIVHALNYQLIVIALFHAHDRLCTFNTLTSTQWIMKSTRLNLIALSLL